MKQDQQGHAKSKNLILTPERRIQLVLTNYFARLKR